MRYSELIGNIQKSINRDVPQVEIGNILNLSRSNINYRKSNDTEFSDEQVQKILDNFGLSFDDVQDNVMLEYYPEVFGSCGGGVFELNQSKELIAVPKRAFFVNVSPIKKYSVINARGTSMTPTFIENDKLIVEHWNGEQIIDNKPYVFCYKDKLFVKRLAENVNQLIITSDNRDYDVIKLIGEELNDVIIIGRIVGLMRDLS